jgi:hypothetical protein
VDKSPLLAKSFSMDLENQRIKRTLGTEEEK